VTFGLEQMVLLKGELVKMMKSLAEIAGSAYRITGLVCNAL
jgi:hypothetical protein